VLAEFERIFRFWLDRGVDGFRIDVSDALIKDTSWADTEGRWPLIPKDDSCGVHVIYRHLRRVMDEYPGDRMAVVETGASDDIVALFIRPDEMHLAFNFRFVKAQWSANDFRAAIEESLAANVAVGAPTTWVSENHDVTRSVTRYGSNLNLEGAYIPGVSGGADADVERGRLRARAIAILLLSLPGAVYIYNGQELGLHNIDDLPDDVIQDPSFFRTNGAVRGRDGCRIPLPWVHDATAAGFSKTDNTWLPVSDSYRPLAVDQQVSQADSMWTLYRDMLALRKSSATLRRGRLEWADATEGQLRYEVSFEGESLAVVVNFGDNPLALSEGSVLMTSSSLDGSRKLPANAAAIVRKF
jgi:alpha-glucosidase